MNSEEIVTMADIREALGVGHKPMLSEIPGIIRGIVEEYATLKEELFCKDTLELMAECKKYATENFRLKARIKEFDAVIRAICTALNMSYAGVDVDRGEIVAEIKNLKNRWSTYFAGEECWIYQGDGTDNLESLVCPVVIRPETLKRIIDMTEPDH